EYSVIMERRRRDGLRQPHAPRQPRWSQRRARDGDQTQADSMITEDPRHIYGRECSAIMEHERWATLKEEMGAMGDSECGAAGGPSRLRSFNPARIGDMEYRAWIAY